jgi:D-amino-acid oxidase
MFNYLPYLKNSFENVGRGIIPKRVEQAELTELCGDFEFVINCSGLGARELVRDNEMKPVEEVVVHTSALADVDSITLLHTGPVFSEYPVYIVPRRGSKADIVLGGTLGQGKDGTPRHIAWVHP